MPGEQGEDGRIGLPEEMGDLPGIAVGAGVVGVIAGLIVTGRLPGMAAVPGRRHR